MSEWGKALCTMVGYKAIERIEWKKQRQTLLITSFFSLKIKNLLEITNKLNSWQV